jgi:hypothetical protein
MYNNGYVIKIPRNVMQCSMSTASEQLLYRVLSIIQANGGGGDARTTETHG